VHTLVLVKDLEKYKQYVKEQKKPDQVVTILKEYSLRVAFNNVYDETIYI